MINFKTTTESNIFPGKLVYTGIEFLFDFPKSAKERASKVFGLEETIIFSAGSHLPRAIFLCRHFGIEAYGVASKIEANNSTRREALARVKALFNTYIYSEPTVLGSRIDVLAGQ
jgi:vancomycin permeability regulator SanA